VDDKAPEVHIGWTVDGAQVAAGDPVLLNGAATDVQDGPISGSDLHWSVDHSPLADGDTLVTSALGEGNHVITLAATNAEGMTGTASIRLTVLPPAPKPESSAEMSVAFRLLLWAIPLAGVLLLVLGAVLLFRRRRRPVG
jgi:LPXTG-motif cell wall-anchored protein